MKEIKKKRGGGWDVPWVGIVLKLFIKMGTYIYTYINFVPRNTKIVFLGTFRGSKMSLLLKIGSTYTYIYQFSRIYLSNKKKISKYYIFSNIFTNIHRDLQDC